MKFISRITKILIVLPFVLIPTFIYAKHHFELKEGDLLFQDIDCGELCDAIEEVTQGYDGCKTSHVGLVVKDSSNKLVVIEAVSKGVVLTDIASFLDRIKDKDNKPKVFVGRLKKEYSYLIPSACELAQTYLGQKYDDYFLLDSEGVYCSELIYNAFKKANNDEPFFELKPMTFKSPKTNEFYQSWLAYYRNLNIPIPEGKLGINPGGISLSDKLQIFFPYGKPDGKK